MTTLNIDTRTLENLVLQAKVSPPRDLEARFAIQDSEQILRDHWMTPGAGQMKMAV